MRDFDSHYGYADSVNRRARWGVVITVLLVSGIALASGATGGGDGPPVSVLSSGLANSFRDPVGVSATTTTSRALEIRADDTTTTVQEPTTTTQPPTATTSSTRPPATTTTTRPAATTTTSTTTTVPPTTTTTTTTTTLPPTTTTTVPPTTTTTTTVPPSTTTTTVPPIADTVHIHDLKGDDKERDDDPYAKIEVRVRNNDSKNQRNVLVTGRFSGGYNGLVGGTTNNKGKVIFESGTVTGETVTFTVINLVHPRYVYAPDDNRRGPSVTVEFD